MASPKFRVKRNNEFNTIYLRFKQGSVFDTEVSTGFESPKDRWSKSKEEILKTNKVDYNKTNKELGKLKIHIRKQYESSKSDSTIINGKWLRNQINVFLNKETKVDDIDSKIFFTKHIEQFIREAKTKRTKKNKLLKPRTLVNYQTTLNKILLFEKHKETRLKINDINLDFHSQFLMFLEAEHKLNPSTVGVYIKNIRIFCKNAERKGYSVSKEYSSTDFYRPSNTTTDIYLKEEEINQVFNCSIETDYLDNAKDWLIIGLWTGLRISDFLKLTNKNIIDGFIEKTTQKTGFPVIIPIHPQVQSVLDKRNGDFPRKISNQKFNDYIKIVCEKAGINQLAEGGKVCPIETLDSEGNKKIIYRKIVDKFPKHELVTSHCCRRSFASNLYGKLDTLTIMKITGHRSESQFLEYIKITPKEYAEKLRYFWKKTYGQDKVFE